MKIAGFTNIKTYDAQSDLNLDLVCRIFLLELKFR